MACIDIRKVTGFAKGTSTNIGYVHLEGNIAAGAACAGPLSITLMVAGKVIGEKLEPGPTDPWTIDIALSGGPFPCGSQVHIFATCMGSSPECSGEWHGIIECEQVCPYMSHISTDYAPEKCLTPLPTVTLVLSAVTAPTASAGKFDWSFGDGSTKLGAGAILDHEFKIPGSFTVSVTFNPEPGEFPGCGPSKAFLALDLCPKSPDPGGGGHEEESNWCWALRLAIVISLVIAGVAAVLMLCFPALVTPLAWITGVAAFIAAGAAVWWELIDCKKPCGWGLLLGWQSAIGIGYVLSYFGKCCPWWMAVGGLAAVGSGLAGAGWWKTKCHATMCNVMVEMGFVLLGVLGPVLSWIELVPLVKACVDPTAKTLLALAAAAIGIAALKCKVSSSPTP